jgi:hypothetical protein
MLRSLRLTAFNFKEQLSETNEILCRFLGLMRGQAVWVQIANRAFELIVIGSLIMALKMIGLLILDSLTHTLK